MLEENVSRFVDAENKELKTAGLYLSFCIVLCYFQVKKLNQDRINSITMLKMIDSTLYIISEQQPM